MIWSSLKGGIVAQWVMFTSSGASDSSRLTAVEFRDFHANRCTGPAFHKLAGWHPTCKRPQYIPADFNVPAARRIMGFLSLPH
jgi:hypothetical protein